jgi:UDP-3-O-[3-hydroxymyristoyl] glucosamine N-acyltransferase
MPRLGMTLEEIRDLIGSGEIIGAADFWCESVASLDQAGADQLSFIKDERYVDQARASKAGALLVPHPMDELDTNQLAVSDPYRCFGLLLGRISEQSQRQPRGVHPQAVVHESARLGQDVTIGAGAVIREETVIGDRSVLYANVYLGQRSVVGAENVIYPGVVIREDTIIGDRVVIHGGSVIGADGYGFVQHEGRHIKVPQVGGILIGDDVEIGALTTIDRATLDRTIIGCGTKVGDQCHIAHNCKIGENVLLLPMVAVSGSVTVGDGAVLAGRSGTADNLRIGAGAVLGGTAVAFKDVPEGATMWGNPAREKGTELRIQAALGRLPEMQRDLRKIKKKLDL